MDTIDFKQFEAWLNKYKNAWEERNPAAVDELYSSDAEYNESPFSTNLKGIDQIKRYWEEGARDSQMNIEFSFEIIAVKSNRGFAKWQAEFDRVGQKIHVKLDGILEAHFDEAGRAMLFNEWWHRKESRP
ncbi:MAG: nuclear transport factor 2 family protein [Bacteroidota bacterium]|nr:nuclear transport factor 2 family protein [Bacteroidota bacterium]